MNWLKNYIEYKAISILAFEKSLETRSTIDKAIKNSSNLRSDLIAKIIETYPDINPTWLITGKGKMLLTDVNEEGVSYNVDKKLSTEFENLPIQKQLQMVFEMQKKTLENQDILADAMEKLMNK